MCLNAGKKKNYFTSNIKRFSAHFLLIEILTCPVKGAITVALGFGTAVPYFPTSTPCISKFLNKK